MTSTRGLWLFAAASFAFAMGCGGTPTPDAGPGFCSSDTQCGSTEVCHPVLKTCVRSCTGSSTCPSEAKTCAKYDGTAATTASPGFCQCSTDALCSNVVAGNICSTATKQCRGKCVGVGGCPANYTCNETSGQCVGGATDGGTDAGVDAGVTTDGGTVCTLNNPQPDTCGYANACGAPVNLVSHCQAAVNDSCANITAAIGASNYTVWNPATSSGPVIYTGTDDPDVAAGCPGGTDVPFTTTLYAYAGTTDFTPTITAAVPLSYFTSTGAKRPINGVQVGTTSNAWSHYTMSNNGKNAEIKMTLCAPAGTTTLTAGFAFSGGNAFCILLTQN